MEANLSPLFYEEIVTEKGRIVVWRSADDLSKRTHSLKKREIERQEVVQMINTLGYTIADLKYKETGQPILSHDSKEFISLSHSNGWYAIYLATEPVGIDIEVERATIAEGKDWFINPVELPKHKSRRALHLVWGAKEAYYKKQEGQIADLRKDVSVEHIEVDTLILEHAGKEEQLFYRQIENTYVVWTD